MAKQDDYFNLISQLTGLSKKEIDFHKEVDRITEDLNTLERNRRCITSQRRFL